MSLEYETSTKKYVWTPTTDRPARTDDFSRVLIDRFIDSDYAENTTLKVFLEKNQNALNRGVLNQLHRRHIISWGSIKEFTAKIAGIPFSPDVVRSTEIIFSFFDIETRVVKKAMKEENKKLRASLWTKIANDMCWVDSNVFIGPSQGNQGTGIDLSVDDKTFLRKTSWRAAEVVEKIMTNLDFHLL